MRGANGRRESVCGALIAEVVGFGEGYASELLCERNFGGASRCADAIYSDRVLSSWIVSRVQAKFGALYEI